MKETDWFVAWARHYLAAKSRHDVDELIGHFAYDVAYEDAVLGRRTTRRELRASYEKIFAALPDDATSRLVWAAGDETGGVLRFDNDAAFFGSPMQVLAVVELRSGMIRRQRDYWDGRQVGAVLNDMRSRFPPHDPRGLGMPVLPHLGGTPLDRLARALWPPGSVGLGELLADEVELHDLALGVHLVGRGEVVRWLASVGRDTPYGEGAQFIGSSGGAGGGALEWAAGPAHAAIGGGAVGVHMARGLVSELTWCWDASRVLEADVIGVTE